MKIEILYPEICSLYGEEGSIMLLDKTFNKDEIYKTSLNEKPRFIDNKVDIVFIGPSTERMQIKIIEKLSKYKKEIKEKIDDGQMIIGTGNALEIFSKKIIKDNKEEVKALGILDNIVEENYLYKRHNSFFLGNFEDIEIVGFKSQFTESYPNNLDYLFEIKKGFPINKEAKGEGIKYKNFYGTYLIGGFLILNPLFLRYLLDKFNDKREIPYFKELMDAYKKRVEEFKNPKTYH